MVGAAEKSDFGGHFESDPPEQKGLVFKYDRLLKIEEDLSENWKNRTLKEVGVMNEEVGISWDDPAKSLG